MMHHARFLLTLCGLFAATTLSLGPARADATKRSKLWGKGGELWRADSRLPDFSYAGYCRGEREIPNAKADPGFDVVADFGARGDGKADDTDAFRRAIRAAGDAGGKVISVPAGRYVLRDRLEIRARGVVLRGAGSKRSILVMPTPLNEIRPNWGATTSGRRTSNYSWSGGFIVVRGSPSNERLATVDAPAKRGARSLRVSSCKKIAVGDEIVVRVRDTAEQSLARHLYANDPGAIDNLGRRARSDFVCRITRVDPKSKRVSVDRPLRTELRLEWTPTISPSASSVEEVGIEGLGFDFPVTPYRGHFTELGYNAVALGGVRNCWVRDLHIRNADSGIFLSGANNTVRDVVIESERDRDRGRHSTGHHGFTLSGPDNLLTDFDIRTRFVHDITMTGGSVGNVIARGRGVDLSLDHHCHANHANLFTDLDLGEGSQMFRSGGGARLGRHSGAWETFWCVRSRRPQSWPRGFGPDVMNLVGVRSDAQPITDRDGKWFEPLGAAETFEPCNLYAAQLARRLAKR